MNNKIPKALHFIIRRPENDMQWPTWHRTLMAQFKDRIVSLSRKGIHYDWGTKRYWVRLRGSDLVGRTFACKWLEQIEDEDFALVIARRNRPFRAACLRHFLKERNIVFHMLRDKRRISFIASRKDIEEMKKIAHVYIVGDWHQKKKEEEKQKQAEISSGEQPSL